MIRKIARLSALGIGLLCCMALLTACARQNSASSIAEAPIPQPSIDLTTRCIGRYLIDMPADIVLNPSGGQRIDDVRLSVTPATAAEYKKALAQRTAELSAGVVSRKGVEYPALRKTTALPAGTDGVLFDFAKLDGSGGRMDRVIEAYSGHRDR